MAVCAVERLARISNHLTPVSAPGNTLVADSVSGEPVAAGSFRAWFINAAKGKLNQRELRTYNRADELPKQDPDATVTVRVKYSDMNYKDAMIMQGQHGVVKSFPIVPGIDFAGVVEQSDSPMWKVGDEVVATGNKCGQHFDGGYSGLCRVQAEWLAPRPAFFNLEECMMIGTAGFTAMLMVMHLEQARMRPGKGKVLVTGASGGVGSCAVAILGKLRYHVVASTGRQNGDYLRSLGASEVIGRMEGDGFKPALQEQKWAAVVDTVGGKTLGAAIAQTKHLGAVACAGVAAGGSLDATAFPFVLRGVRLLGVDSTLPWNVAGFESSREAWEEYRRERLEVWRRLGEDLPVQALRRMHAGTISLEEVPEWADKLIAGGVGSVRGRLVVKC